MEFDWNDAKAASNKAKHGVSFQQAVDALRGSTVIEELDLRDDYGEERVIATAMLDAQVLVIIYTLRDGIARLISARRANKHEQQNYYRQVRY